MTTIKLGQIHFSEEELRALAAVIRDDLWFYHHTADHALDALDDRPYWELAEKTMSYFCQHRWKDQEVVVEEQHMHLAWKVRDLHMANRRALVKEALRVASTPEEVADDA